MVDVGKIWKLYETLIVRGGIDRGESWVRIAYDSYSAMLAEIC